MAEVELQTIKGDEENFDKFPPVEAIPVKDDEPATVEHTEDQQQNGVENAAFSEQADEGLTIPPPMTYVEFLPRLLEEALSAAEAPIYAEFSTVVEQANQWLKGNPNFQVMKVETYFKKLLDKDVLDPDTVIYHESSHGINKYLKGLRLWLAPADNTETEPQQIGYLTTVPDPSDDSETSADEVNAVFVPARFRSSISAPSYCGMAVTVEKLNKFLKKKPIPGKILNVETVKVKFEDTDAKCINTEKMCWADCGRVDRIYIYAVRIFYIIGKPAFETIGFHDEVPACLNNFELTSRLRLSPFTTVVQRARKWLTAQKGIRVNNMQTVDIFCERERNGEARIHADKCGHVEPAGHDLQFAKVLRIYYIQDSKSSVCPYESLKLTTRLFIPTRRGQWGKDCESFSKTMQRVIAWLQITKTPIFGVEAIHHPFSPDSYGTGVREDAGVATHIGNSGKYFITTVRLYFPCEYEEPSPDLLPPVEEEQGWWACNVS